MFPGIKFMCEWEFDERFREVPDVPGVWAYVGIDQTLMGRFVVYAQLDDDTVVLTGIRWTPFDPDDFDNDDTDAG